MDKEDLLTLGGLITLIILVGVFVVYHDRGVQERAEALLNQCMADGKKEYECHAMLDVHQQVIAVPVVVGK